MDGMREKMEIKNDFKEVCKKADKCNSKCLFNPIVCAKSQLRLYVNNNLDLLLKIKAEAIDDDYYSFVSGLFTMLACAVSVFSLMVSLTDLLKDCERMITIIMLAIVIIIATGYLTIRLGIGLVKHSVCRKWRPYILIAVEEVEEELRKNKK